MKKERYSKKSIKKYLDGWWITLWVQHRKCRIKLVGSFKTKSEAEHEREALNNIF